MPSQVLFLSSLPISPYLLPCATTFPTRFYPFNHSVTYPSPFACSHTYSASKGTSGSGWVATSFSFPPRLSSHSAVACSVRAERTPGSPPEASVRRSPPLPAHLRALRMEHHCPGCYLMAPLNRQTKPKAWAVSPHPPLHLTGCVQALLISFLFFC